ncbi:MAG TPA: TylF/MycF/NovP-related O-methyltransferase [Cyclobacteriaceae bacterium]|nr:TylF/MycF/NovP-related O-methyltransferase [Cyclobacteriaceae bacterium]
MNEYQRKYLDLLQLLLTDYHRIERGEFKPILGRTWKTRMLQAADKFLKRKDYTIQRIVKTNKNNRLNGLDWPSYSETMIGIKRLQNIEYCISKIIDDKIEGDLIETGVWRGGGSMYMKAVLNVLDSDKNVWLADSFEGLPKPNTDLYPDDAGLDFSETEELKVSAEEVRANFEKYNLLDDKVKFVKGWFKDTLPGLKVDKISLMRLDGDLYESAWDSITNLYPKLSVGGFVIVDDWGLGPATQKALQTYRKQHGIHDEIIDIDGSGVYWRRSS